MTKEQAIEKVNKIITTKFNNDYSIDNKDKEAIEHILSDYKRVLEMNKILLKENEQLKNDIKNMYDEEVIISIIEDNFNLCRNEVLELLESEEK